MPRSITTKIMATRTINLPALWAIMGDWLIIALSLLLAVYLRTWWALALAAVLVARSQLALAVMMHEGAHGSIAKSRALNNGIAQWCCAGPLFLSMLSYREGHLKHHRAPMAHDDPVACVFDVHGYPMTRLRFFGKCLLDLTTLTYWYNAFRIMRGDFRHVLPVCKKTRTCLWLECASMLFANGLLWATLNYFDAAIFYWTLWILPALTLLPLFGRIRAIMEHAGYPATENQAHNARTITQPNWQTFLCGPHAIHYHIEHHLYPMATFDQLQKMHTQLAKKGQLPAQNLYTGYFKILKEVTY